MIDVSYVVLEDSLRTKKAGVDIYEGQPVSLDENGLVIPAAANKKVYGIAKTDANKYRDYTYGEVGAYGSGKLSIVLSGIIRVKASSYNAIEIDQSGSTSTPVTIKIFDDTKTYAPGDVLYVDSNGLITNAPSDKTSIFGKVINPPSNDGWLEILVEPMIAVSTADLVNPQN